MVPALRSLHVFFRNCDRSILLLHVLLVFMFLHCAEFIVCPCLTVAESDTLRGGCSATVDLLI